MFPRVTLMTGMRVELRYHVMPQPERSIGERNRVNSHAWSIAELSSVLGFLKGTKISNENVIGVQREQAQNGIALQLRAFKKKEGTIQVRMGVNAHPTSNPIRHIPGQNVNLYSIVQPWCFLVMLEMRMCPM